MSTSTSKSKSKKNKIPSHVKLPETAPFVTARNLCRGKLADQKGRYCLMGLLEKHFPKAELAVSEALMTQIKKVDPTTSLISEFNDEERNPNGTKRTLDDVAKVWNNAMTDLGYGAVKYTRRK